MEINNNDKYINDKYSSGFLDQVDASRRGEVTFIPLNLDRVNNDINIMQSRYTFIFGATGSGKTSFVDDKYILCPWRDCKEAIKNGDIHWEVIYFSLERKQMFKHAKWVSWMIYKDHGHRITADQLLGWGDKPLSKKGYELVRSYDDEITELLEHVHIYDGKCSKELILEVIEKRAKDLGVFYYTDDQFLYMGNSALGIKNFKEHGKTVNTKTGPKVYIEHEHNGKKFKLFQHDHRYFMHNPKTFVFIVMDGINLLGGRDDLEGISTAIADSRDKYGFSPVIISQQNRAMGDVQRLKIHGTDMSPQIEDAFKSSQMGFDADLIIGLFDPVRYKAFDESGKYGGYIIKSTEDSVSTQCMTTPDGKNRFRSLHILKNSFGTDGAIYGLKFVGEVMYFETLPKPDDVFEMNIVYEKIARGH